MSNQIHLFVGIDISTTAGNVATFLDSNGQRVNKDLSFANNQSGAEFLISTLFNIAQSSKIDSISIGIESTGVYSWHLQHILSSHPRLVQFKLNIYQINPKLTRNFKKAYPDLPKTDPIDAFVIADRIRFGRLPLPVNNNYTYLSLQKLTRYRFHLMENIVREKSRFLTTLFFKFSNYKQDSPFSNLFGNTSSAVITEFYSTDEIVSMSLEELSFFLIKKGKNHFANPIAIAKELKRIATLSYKLPDQMKQPINFILASSLHTIRSLEAQVKQTDKAIEREMTMIKHPLLSVDGLGPVLVAGIIAEIGDISRFHDHPALAKFAGLWWKKYQSGNFEAEETRLAKSGNKYLRYYLVEAANLLMIHNPVFKAYYTKKYSEVTKHQHKRALVLSARKLVRVIFSLLRSKKLYELPIEA